jgi:hypothetical protein
MVASVLLMVVPGVVREVSEEVEGRKVQWLARAEGMLFLTGTLC